MTAINTITHEIHQAAMEYQQALNALKWADEKYIDAAVYLLNYRKERLNALIKEARKIIMRKEE